MVLEKQLLYSISNWNKKSCYKLEKIDNYYDFLFGLLKIANIPIPDIYDAEGKADTIFEFENTVEHYTNDDEDIEIIEITSEAFIFLIIYPINKDIQKYISENYEFIKKISDKD